MDSSGNLSRCDRGRAYPAVEQNPRDDPESMDGWTCHSAAGLDAQKKTLGATERDEQQRADYRERVAHRRCTDFVIVDECGSNIDLTPIYARAPDGTRAYGHVPRNKEQNTTLIASLSTQGMGPAMVLPGATNTAAFEVYIEHFLVPSLTAGHIVVLDNLSAHKSVRVRRLIEAQGCELWYLPAYSPDLSPIEEAFSKLKHALRRTGARTHEALEHAIAESLDMITAQDAQSYLTHCGYGTAKMTAH